MVLVLKILHFAALATWLLVGREAQAFPNGAGSCPSGEPAVGDPHRTASEVVNGSLEDGNIELLLDGDRMSTDKTVFLKTKKQITVALKAPFSKNGFKGFLIRLGDNSPSSNDIGMSVTLGLPSNAPSTNLTDAKVEESLCEEQNALGLTHNDSTEKYLVEGELQFDTEFLSGLVLDVTVVMSNTAEKSEYYYSQFNLQALDVPETPVPTEADVGTIYHDFGDYSSSWRLCPNYLSVILASVMLAVAARR